MIYDVAIIGGGIAGLALSLDLRARGYSIALVEKGTYPRHKVCGEYISMESHAYLHRICPPLGSVNVPLINKFSLSSTGRSVFSTRLDPGGFGISRYTLEKILYETALESGVTFFLKTRARDITAEDKNHVIETDTGQVRARLVCNSSGRRSNMDASHVVKGTNYVGVKYHIKSQRDPDLIEIHNFPGGYCGVSAIEEDLYCLCYMLDAKKLKAAGSIKEAELQVLSQNKRLKHILEEAEFVFKEPLTISGINFAIKTPLSSSSFFLGDSAGTIAPITGNGMSIGLRSAHTLAGQIHLFFSGSISREQLAGNYNAFWKKQFSSRIRVSRHLQKLSEYPSLTKFTIGVFNSLPAVAGKVIAQTHGQPF